MNNTYDAPPMAYQTRFDDNTSSDGYNTNGINSNNAAVNKTATTNTTNSSNYNTAAVYNERKNKGSVPSKVQTTNPKAAASTRDTNTDNYPQKTDYKRFVKEKKYIPWWILLVLICVVVVLMTVEHKHIVNWLRPVSARIRALSWGWVIPILILIALSFPPLFGHEIIIILVGVVYGLWIGFGIVAAGTIIGEVCTWFAFKGFLRKHAEKLERKNLDFGALARITREGGFLIVFIVRLSVIPGHFSTAVFATCGVKFWVFLLASFITLPKQIVIVYLGVIINNPGSGKTVSDIVLGITFLITVLCAVYIWWRLKAARKVMLAEADGSTEEGVAMEGNEMRRGETASGEHILGGEDVGRDGAGRVV